MKPTKNRTQEGGSSGAACSAWERWTGKARRPGGMTYKIAETLHVGRHGAMILSTRLVKALGKTIDIEVDVLKRAVRFIPGDTFTLNLRQKADMTSPRGYLGLGELTRRYKIEEGTHPATFDGTGWVWKMEIEKPNAQAEQ